MIIQGLLCVLSFAITVTTNSEYCSIKDQSTNCQNMMKSIEHNESENSVKLVHDTPIPVMGEGDILIKVAAAGVNRLDLMQRKGNYPPPPGAPNILGVEVSGTVEKLSPLAQEKSSLSEGDRVMALIGGGGYAEYTVAPYQCVMPLPKELTFEQGAAIPEAYITAYQAIVWNGYLSDGETVVIHAAASGVGTAAIQMAKALCSNVTVIATSRTAAKLPLCKDCGADVVINTKESDFADEVLKATGGKGANLVLDFIGAPYWENNIKSLAVDGRLMLIANLGGAQIDSPGFNLRPFLGKRLTVRGSTLRSRSLDYKDKLIKEISQKLLPGFINGKLWPVMDKTYSIQNTDEAHQRMESNSNQGKIVLTL